MLVISRGRRAHAITCLQHGARSFAAAACCNAYGQSVFVLQECKDENYEFISKVFLRSGISPCGTYLPAWINPVHTSKPKYDMDIAKKEAEMTMCGAVAELLERTGAEFIAAVS